MSTLNPHELWDYLSIKAWEMVDFTCITHGVNNLDDDERDAVQLGLASGITATLEYFRDNFELHSKEKK